MKVKKNGKISDQDLFTSSLHHGFHGGRGFGAYLITEQLSRFSATVKKKFKKFPQFRIVPFAKCSSWLDLCTVRPTFPP